MAPPRRARVGRAPERRTYTPGLDGAAGTLVASDRHVPLPAPEEIEEEERRTWLQPILGVMLP